MISIARNNEFYTSYYGDMNDDRVNENDEEAKESIPGLDEFDFRLLNIQASALLILITGYILEYISTLQAIEVIKIRQSNEESVSEPDPDITALIAAQYQVIAQAVLVQISKIQYRNTPLHYRTGNLNAARSATFEILISDILEEIAYLFNLAGVRKIYSITHDGPIYGI